MYTTHFPVIDLEATGQNIVRLRKARGLSVKDIQLWFGFEEPQAIYKWQKGKSLPTVDNLYALSTLLGVPMDKILVSKPPHINHNNNGQQVTACCPSCFIRLFRIRQKSENISVNFCIAANSPKPKFFHRTEYRNITKNYYITVTG